MTDDRAFRDGGGSERQAFWAKQRGVHVATASRVFASGLVLAALGAALWTDGAMTAAWPIKMVGVCSLALGCLTATGALLFAE